MKTANRQQFNDSKKIKESGVYKELPNIKTWENYCKSVGFSRQKVDLDLQNLATFGEEFLLTVSSFGLGYRELWSLSKQVETVLRNKNYGYKSRYTKN